MTASNINTYKQLMVHVCALADRIDCLKHCHCLKQLEVTSQGYHGYGNRYRLFGLRIFGILLDIYLQ